MKVDFVLLTFGELTMKKDLVVLSDLGKTNPFNFGIITTAYFLPNATNFDYTYGGKYQVIAKGVTAEEAAEFKREVPVGFYMMAALGKAYSDGKFSMKVFQFEFAEFRSMLMSGQVHNLQFGQFDRRILPTIGMNFLMFLSTFLNSKQEFKLEEIALIPGQFDLSGKPSIPAI